MANITYKYITWTGKKFGSAANFYYNNSKYKYDLVGDAGITSLMDISIFTKNTSKNSKLPPVGNYLFNKWKIETDSALYKGYDNPDSVTTNFGDLILLNNYGGRAGLLWYLVSRVDISNPDSNKIYIYSGAGGSRDCGSYSTESKVKNALDKLIGTGWFLRFTGNTVSSLLTNSGKLKKNYYYTWISNSDYDLIEVGSTKPLHYKGDPYSKGDYIDGGIKFYFSKNFVVTATWNKPQYTIHVDTNGSDTGWSDIKGYYPDGCKSWSGVGSKEGYTFTHFSLKLGTDTIQDNIKLNDNISCPIVHESYKLLYSEFTLLANWNANKYIVTFNANGGSVPSSTSEVIYNSKYGNLPTPTRVGYNFIGWFTELTGGSKVVSDSIFNYVSNITLYAHWENGCVYSISFNKNATDATGSMNDMTGLKYNENRNLSKNLFSRVGYTFSEWNINSDGSGKSYKNEQAVKELTSIDGSTVILYAIWTENEYILKFNGNGSTSGELEDKTLKYTQLYSLPESPYIRIGFRFKGYSISSSGTGVTYNVGQSINKLSSSNGSIIILYAVWEEITVNVIYHNTLINTTEVINEKCYREHNVRHITRGELNSVCINNFPYLHSDGKYYYFIGWTDRKIEGSFIPNINLNSMNWIRSGYNILVKLDNIDLYSVFVEAKYLETIEIKNVEFNTPEITDDRLINKRTGKFIYENLKDIPPIGYFYLNWLSRFYKEVYNGVIEESYSKTPEGEIKVDGGDPYNFLTTTTSNLISNAVSRTEIDFDANWERNIVRITYHRNPLPGYEYYSDLYYEDYIKGTEITIKSILEELNWGIYGVKSLGYNTNSNHSVNNDYIEGKVIKLNNDLDLYCVWETNLFKLVYHRNTLYDRDSEGKLLENEITKTFLKEGPDELNSIYNGFKLDCISDLDFSCDKYFPGVNNIWYKFIGWGVSKDTSINDSSSTGGTPNLIKYDDFDANNYDVVNHIWLSKGFSKDNTYDKGIFGYDETKTVHKYAIWESLKVVMSYNKNQPSGTDIVGQQKYSYDKIKNNGFRIDEENLSNSLWKTLDKEGIYYYDFLGWSTSSTGSVSTIWISGNDKSDGIDKDTNIYAKWNDVTVTVTYKSNYSGGQSDKVFKYRLNSSQSFKNISDSDIGFSRDKWEFLGWSTKSGEKNPVEYQPGEFIDEGNLRNRTYVFYAVWSNSATLIYNANGGVFGFSTFASTKSHTGEVKVNESLTLNSSASLELNGDYAGWFTGWSKSKSGKVEYGDSSNSYIPNEKINYLYAKWNKYNLSSGCGYCGGTNNNLTGSMGTIDSDSDKKYPNKASLKDYNPYLIVSNSNYGNITFSFLPSDYSDRLTYKLSWSGVKDNRVYTLDIEGSLISGIDNLLTLSGSQYYIGTSHVFYVLYLGAGDTNGKFTGGMYFGVVYKK